MVTVVTPSLGAYGDPKTGVALLFKPEIGSKKACLRCHLFRNAEEQKKFCDGNQDGQSVAIQTVCFQVVYGKVACVCVPMEEVAEYVNEGKLLRGKTYDAIADSVDGLIGNRSTCFID